MSLFQCEHCGCKENTALSLQGAEMEEYFDWDYAPERKGKKLCSECGPPKYKSGQRTGLGEWHGKFKQVFLPAGEFITNAVGNLEHKTTGDTDLSKYE